MNHYAPIRAEDRGAGLSDARAEVSMAVGSPASALAEELAREFTIYDLLRFLTVAMKAADLTTLVAATMEAVRLTDTESPQAEGTRPQGRTRETAPVSAADSPTIERKRVRFDPIPIRAED